jgi:hypothetical protein
MTHHNRQLRFDGGSIQPPQPKRGQLLPRETRQLVPAQRQPPATPAPETIRINGQVVERTPAPPEPQAGRWQLTRATPHRTPDSLADVIVPGLQALLTALAFGSGVGLIAWAFGWSWRVPLVVMGLAVIAGWLWRLHVVDRLLWRIETALRRDLNRDGATGQPTLEHPFTVVDQVEARATAHQVQALDDESEKRDELLSFLARCYTHGTSEAAHRIKAGGPDRDKYLDCRDTLLDLGVGAWKNTERPRAGWILTMSEADAEELVMRHVL